jgi:membrane associated rhomboid family serine protease
MGYEDRDYYREGSPGTFVTSMVVKLIIINGLVFLANLLFGGPEHSLTDSLALRPSTIVHPLTWWRFLTAGFVHDPNAINHIFFNMLGLYVFGSRLEERYGSREFLRFYLIAIVLGFVVWSASNYLYLQQLPAALAVAVDGKAKCFGASGGVTAVTLLYCLLYPRATLLASFLFPVPAWIIGALIVVSNVFGQATSSPLFGGVAYDVHLVGIALAAGYWYFGWNFGRLPGGDELRRLLGRPQRWFKPRPPLKVHDPEQYYEDLDAEADRLLEKVSREGESSLTPQERRALEDYSRRMRQKLR